MEEKRVKHEAHTTVGIVSWNNDYWTADSASRTRSWISLPSCIAAVIECNIDQ